LESLKLPRTIDYIDTKDPERPAFDIPPYIEAHEDSLVKIRIPPDVDGRFGFNVKGGSDLGMPILVSRVAPNTPADHCYPRLNEGDQVCFLLKSNQHQHKLCLPSGFVDKWQGNVRVEPRPSCEFDPNVR
jgi:tyrosine-protein phosphatase non-receptor type 4